MNETTGVIIAFGLLTLLMVGIALFQNAVSPALFAVGTALLFGFFVGGTVGSN